MQRLVDYALAKRAVLRDLRVGRTSRLDVCDAHAELLRAARNCGQDAGTCPVCGRPELRLVGYAFSPDLRRDNGRVWPLDDLVPLNGMRDARLFTVEVCLDCSWNHIRTQLSFGVDEPRRGREASP